MLEEFKKFAMRGNVVDLAVGVIIGAAFGAIVTSLVGDIIMPIIGAVTGGLDFSNYFVPLSDSVTAPALADALRRAASAAPESGIVEAMNYGREREGLIPLWAGEGDLATPAFICEAATRSLAAGETFYTWQRGIPELRQALARYHTMLYGRAFAAEEFYVTGSGMQAIQIVLAMVAGAADEGLIPTPDWPNAAPAAGIMGARAVEVPMAFGNDGRSIFSVSPVQLRRKRARF